MVIPQLGSVPCLNHGPEQRSVHRVHSWPDTPVLGPLKCVHHNLFQGGTLGVVEYQITNLSQETVLLAHHNFLMFENRYRHDPPLRPVMFLSRHVQESMHQAHLISQFHSLVVAFHLRF